MSRTFSIIKPDATKRNLTGSINKIIENNNIFAEFSATIDNIEINGIDFMRLENSLIIEFRVFIRPIKGLEKVWSQMRKNLN